jgi:hypothetical protein
LSSWPFLCYFCGLISLEFMAIFVLFLWSDQSEFMAIFVLFLWSDQSEFMAIFMVLNLWVGPGFIFEFCS